MHEATSAARAFADGAGINAADSARLAILVEELVTNLYDHGGLNAGDVFAIELSTTATEINVVLIDSGRAFDPTLPALDPTIPERGGGAGLKLVRAWASQIDYQTIDGQNRLAVWCRLGDSNT